MKGQMFMVTMIFLAGLIMSVQQILIQYARLDLGQPFIRDDSELLQSIVNIINKSVRPCSEQNIRELFARLSKQDFGIYDVRIAWDLNCSRQKPLHVDIQILSPGSKTEASYDF